jgi:hypothetical protein
MKSLLRLTAVLFSSLLLGSVAQADLISFSDEFSGSGDTCGNVSCATLLVVQDGADVDFTLTSNLASGEFITGLYGNIDPFQLANSIFTNVDASAISGWSLTGGLDCCKADGDGNFDYAWGFPTSGDVLEGTDVFSWTFQNISLADVMQGLSQGGPEGKTGFNFALRVQGLGAGNGGSGWFYSTPGTTTVPEPGTLALLGIGLLGMGLMRRRQTS